MARKAAKKTAAKKVAMSAKLMAAIAERRYGARLERRATRDGIRRMLRNPRPDERSDNYAEGLAAVLSFLGGRIPRTKRPGGVGR